MAGLMLRDVLHKTSRKAEVTLPLAPINSVWRVDYERKI